MRRENLHVRGLFLFLSPPKWTSAKRCVCVRDENTYQMNKFSKKRQQNGGRQMLKRKDENDVNVAPTRDSPVSTRILSLSFFLSVCGNAECETESVVCDTLLTFSISIVISHA